MDYALPACLALILGLLLVRYTPWMLLCVLLLVPVLKTALITYTPVLEMLDPTPLACAAVGLAAFWKWYRSRNNGYPLQIPWVMLCGLITLGAVMVIGLEWSTAPDYGFRKAFRFCGIGIPFLLLPTFLIRERRDIVLFSRPILCAALVATGLAVLIPESELSVERHGASYTRATPLGSDPLMPAILTAMGILVALAFLIKGTVSKTRKLLIIAFIFIALVAILMSGTRSALVGLIFPFAMIFAASGRMSFMKASLVGFCAIAASFLLFEFALEIIPQVSDRWLSFFAHLEQGNLEVPFESRLPHYELCLSNWDRYPILGHGTGSFAAAFFGVDTPGWPHNIILEALYENGLVGLAGLMIFLLGVFKAAINAYGLYSGTNDRQSEKAMLLALTGILVLLTVHGMVHSDLDAMRLMFLIAGALHASVAIAIKAGISQKLAGAKATVGPPHNFRASATGSY